jgi:hypothetical protein
MIPEDRDKSGKLRVGYFIALGMKFAAQKGYYNQAEFKDEIEKSTVLKPQDWESDGTHKHTWRHRVERATQRIRTGI